MANEHKFEPIDVNSQICKVCGGSPGGRTHKARAAETKMVETKPQTPAPPAEKK